MGIDPVGGATIRIGDGVAARRRRQHGYRRVYVMPASGGSPFAKPGGPA
jgi:hypothetical protein